jgi:hypothetical protein
METHKMQANGSVYETGVAAGIAEAVRLIAALDVHLRMLQAHAMKVEQAQSLLAPPVSAGPLFNARTNWTSKLEATAVGLAQGGKTVSEIASEIKCSPGAAQFRLRRLLSGAEYQELLRRSYAERLARRRKSTRQFGRRGRRNSP